MAFASMTVQHMVLVAIMLVAGCERDSRGPVAAPALSVSPAPPPSATSASAPPEKNDPRPLITVHGDGTVTASIAGAPACPTRQPADCRAELEKREPRVVDLRIRAEPGASYQSLVSVIDVLRSDDVGIQLEAPPGTENAKCTATDEVVAESAAEKLNDAQFAVLITRTKILVGVATALSVDSFTAEGVAAEHKRCGRADPFIVPVAKLLPKEHPRETVLVADRDTPYRVLWEVFYTIQHTLPGRVQLLTTTRAN